MMKKEPKYKDTADFCDQIFKHFIIKICGPHTVSIQEENKPYFIDHHTLLRYLRWQIIIGNKNDLKHVRKTLLKKTMCKKIEDLIESAAA